MSTGKGCTSEVAVYVYATDPVSQSGMSLLVDACCGASVVADIDAAEVAVVVADKVDSETARTIAALQRDGSPPVVLVATRLDDSGLMAAIESGVAGLVYRDQVDSEHLGQTLQDVSAGRGSLPSDLTGRLMQRMADMQREQYVVRAASTQCVLLSLVSHAEASSSP